MKNKVVFILPNFPIPIQAVVTKKWASFSDDDAEIYMLHKNLFACSDKNFNILQWPSVDTAKYQSKKFYFRPNLLEERIGGIVGSCDFNDP